jgi:hypothetical protein
MSEVAASRNTMEMATQKYYEKDEVVSNSYTQHKKHLTTNIKGLAMASIMDTCCCYPIGMVISSCVEWYQKEFQMKRANDKLLQME